MTLQIRERGRHWWNGCRTLVWGNRDIRRTKATQLWDLQYLSTKPDFTSIDSYVKNYCKGGWQTNVEPNQFFDSLWYVSQYNEARSYPNPLLHFAEVGWRKGFSPSPLFDLRDYLFRNPDVHRANINPLAHYLKWGRHEQRQIRKFFEPSEEVSR
jgi:hypothetical protein